MSIDTAGDRGGTMSLPLVVSEWNREQEPVPPPPERPQPHTRPQPSSIATSKPLLTWVGEKSALKRCRLYAGYVPGGSALPALLSPEGA